MKRSSRDLALCGVLCALAVAIMAMGTILPAATYCCPVLASMTLVPVLILCGERLSWAMFAASAILSLLFAPDKEAAAIFLARLDALREELFSMGLWLTLALILGGNVIFWLDDMLLERAVPRIAALCARWTRKHP